MRMFVVVVMPSFFPPPGPTVAHSPTLLVQGQYHSSASIYLALSHVLEDSKHEALILSPSQSLFQNKLETGLDEWLIYKGTTNAVKAAMTRVNILYPPTPAHFSLLISTLTGLQTNAELLRIWSDLVVVPTSQLSLIILDGISSYFSMDETSNPTLFISLLTRVLHTAGRLNAQYTHNCLSVVCFEPTSKDEHRSHLQNAFRSLFKSVYRFDELEVEQEVPSSQDEENYGLDVDNKVQKVVHFSTVGGKEGVIEYTEVLSNVNGKLVKKFVWDMHPFATYVLRTYYKATDWNEDNLYANLTRSSNAVLDFTVPRGLHFSISKSPNPMFKTTYAMTAMPSLNGSFGYIFTSCDLNVKSSDSVPFKNMIERFRISDQPRKPEPKEEVWLAGERIDKRDYLMYGRFYLPTGRLDALYSTRLSPTVQAMVAAISDPPYSSPPEMSGRNANMSNIMLSLQHDIGKWCTEYNYSAEDGMWGVRFLHNFGRLGTSCEVLEQGDHATQYTKIKRVDEEDAVEGGLKGRVSLGAELYFSAREKSAGVSTGIRFTTLPDATPPSAQLPNSSGASSSSVATPNQTPTTVTCLFNPMLGHISSAFTAKASQDLALSTRFDFNVYSFESEWTMGAEYWLHRKPQLEDEQNAEEVIPQPVYHPESQQGVQGVIKGRISTKNDVSLLWEGRIRNVLVSLGLIADLSSRTKPVKAIGLELSYFSSSDD